MSKCDIHWWQHKNATREGNEVTVVYQRKSEIHVQVGERLANLQIKETNTGRKTEFVCLNELILVGTAAIYLE